jgi:hypothetical protein
VLPPRTDCSRGDLALVDFKGCGEGVDHHCRALGIDVAMADGVDPAEALGDVLEPTPQCEFSSAEADLLHLRLDQFVDRVAHVHT